MYIIQLTDADADGRKVYVNLDRVVYFRDEKDDSGYPRCRLFMETDHMLLVRENSHQITNMIERHNMRR